MLARVQFGRETFLTPGEQDVLRRFCARFRELPCLPQRVSVFGSRAKGDSHAHSDLDVAVLMDGSHNPAMDTALSAIALGAQKNYWLGEYGISLRPVAIYAGEAVAFLDAIGNDEEVVWTRP
ncbi:MAG: nucleotidyltransferase domain-containing protein [Betaproteobacteria bacterium]|nr:nucleotidyltransferase domain-containing protein [Betaproteobacteria bacterium]